MHHWFVFCALDVELQLAELVLGVELVLGLRNGVPSSFWRTDGGAR